MPPDPDDPAPEFPRPVAVDLVGLDGRHEVLEATAEERARLAERLMILGIDRLSAEVWLRRIAHPRLGPPGEVIRVEGEIDAAVTQSCVVSGEPVPEPVQERFVVNLAPVGSVPEPDEDTLADDDDEDPYPEDYAGGVIDVGELVSQFLALGLDPYPRAPDAEIPPEYRAAQEPETPFAALAAFKRKPTR